jgi:hypothetical protein
MSIIGSNILAGASGQGGGYTIENSLRFRKSGTAYLNKTFGSAPTSRTTMTMSVWVKRGLKSDGSAYQAIFGTFNNYENVSFNSDDTLRFTGPYSSGQQGIYITTQKFRDYASWYHIVVVYDTTNATAENRMRLFVNGVQVTSFSTQTNSNQNNTTTEFLVNGAVSGIGTTGAASLFDGYLAEVNVIDGQALDPSSFGEYNEDTGAWQPIRYSGSYGNNGFYLPFSDATNTTTLVADSSGNGNDWTPNNISLTSGVTYDSMTDTPTPYADGGNYATLLPTAPGTGTISNANLTSNSPTTTVYSFAGTMLITTGKWYWEVTATTINAANQYPFIGAYTSPIPNSLTGAVRPGADTNIGGFSLRQNGNFYYNGSTSATITTSFTTGDVIGIAFDADAQSVTYYKNGSSIGTQGSLGSGPWVTAISEYNGSLSNHNFGQRPFAYTPPTGFLPLHTGNLPDSAIVDGSQYFDVVTRTGTGAEATVTGLQFQPDLLWTKTRSNAVNHSLTSTGLTYNYSFLQTNTTEPENTSASQYYMIPTADGYTVGTGDNINQVSRTFVDWVWKANGAGVSNTDGSITSTVSANPTAGFSVVTYTGSGSAGATVGHSLGVAPSMLIVKPRSASGDDNWKVYHSSIGGTGALLLNTTSATSTSSVYWNNTAPTSSVFTVGSSASANYTNQNTIPYVAYCFADVEGYSKFGSYTGNGSSDGPFVYLGFRPAWIMIKETTNAGSWYIQDSTRDVDNPVQALYPVANGTLAENSSWGNIMDLLSNGFKPRVNDTAWNRSGGTYIYMAFAENPFKNSLAR